MTARLTKRKRSEIINEETERMDDVRTCKGGCPKKTFKPSKRLPFDSEAQWMISLENIGRNASESELPLLESSPIQEPIYPKGGIICDPNGQYISDVLVALIERDKQNGELSANNWCTLVNDKGQIVENLHVPGHKFIFSKATVVIASAITGGAWLKHRLRTLDPTLSIVCLNRINNLRKYTMMDLINADIVILALSTASKSDDGNFHFYVEDETICEQLPTALKGFKTCDPEDPSANEFKQVLEMTNLRTLAYFFWRRVIYIPSAQWFDTCNYSLRARSLFSWVVTLSNMDSVSDKSVRQIFSFVSSSENRRQTRLRKHDRTTQIKTLLENRFSIVLWSKQDSLRTVSRTVVVAPSPEEVLCINDSRVFRGDGTLNFCAPVCFTYPSGCVCNANDLSINDSYLSLKRRLKEAAGYWKDFDSDFANQLTESARTSGQMVTKILDLVMEIRKSNDSNLNFTCAEYFARTPQMTINVNFPSSHFWMKMKIDTPGKSHNIELDSPLSTPLSEEQFSNLLAIIREEKKIENEAYSDILLHWFRKFVATQSTGQSKEEIENRIRDYDAKLKEIMDLRETASEQLAKLCWSKFFQCEKFFDFDSCMPRWVREMIGVYGISENKRRLSLLGSILVFRYLQAFLLKGSHQLSHEKLISTLSNSLSFFSQYGDAEIDFFSGKNSFGCGSHRFCSGCKQILGLGVYILCCGHAYCRECVHTFPEFKNSEFLPSCDRHSPYIICKICNVGTTVSMYFANRSRDFIDVFFEKARKRLVDSCDNQEIVIIPQKNVSQGFQGSHEAVCNSKAFATINLVVRNISKKILIYVSNQNAEHHLECAGKREGIKINFIDYKPDALKRIQKFNTGKITNKCLWTVLCLSDSKSVKGQRFEGVQIIVFLSLPSPETKEAILSSINQNADSEPLEIYDLHLMGYEI